MMTCYVSDGMLSNDKLKKKGNKSKTQRNNKREPSDD
jgi:hypothetical protein